MEYISTIWGYIVLVFMNAFGIAGTVLTLIDIGTKASGKQIPKLGKGLMRVAALVLFFMASFQAYYSAKQPVVVPGTPVIAENPGSRQAPGSAGYRE